MRRFARYAAIGLAILVATPFLLTLLYRIEAVRPVSTLMLADLARLKTYERDWVEFDAIAPALVQSVVMSEDGKFCRHWGVDFGELRAVVEKALDGEETRGASTVTMQTAKNLFLWSGRSVVRKAIELPLAMWVDLVLPKKRIMEIYLNIAEWGDGVYGIEAASWTRFGRPAFDLTPRQAALMAVSLPNPLQRDPAAPSTHLNRLANVIETRARRSGAYVDCLY